MVTATIFTYRLSAFLLNAESLYVKMVAVTVAAVDQRMLNLAFDSHFNIDHWMRFVMLENEKNLLPRPILSSPQKWRVDRIQDNT